MLAKLKISLLNSTFILLQGDHEVESGLLNTHQERSVFSLKNIHAVTHTFKLTEIHPHKVHVLLTA